MRNPLHRALFKHRLGYISGLLLALAGLFLWIESERLAERRQAYAESLNTEEDANGYFVSQGRTLVVELTDRDTGLADTDAVADYFVHGGGHIQELVTVGFDHIEVVGRDESAKAVRLIR